MIKHDLEKTILTKIVFNREPNLEPGSSVLSFKFYLISSETAAYF
jgi:hypothetical protein